MNQEYLAHGDEFVLNCNYMVNTMKEISLPLMDGTKISNFSYLQFEKSGKVINLTTDIEVIKYRFQEKIKYQILFEQELKDSKLNEPYIYLWPQNPSSDILKSLAHQGIGNGCNIFIRKLDLIEVYSFAADINELNMQSFYINNLNTLKGFILDFKNKIDGSLDNKLKLDTDIKFPSTYNNYCEKTPSNYFDNFDIKKPRKMNINNTILTMKEIECCFYLMQGYQIKDIACCTNLAPRTVESHINSVKSKTNSVNKGELLAFLQLNNWIFNSLFHK